MDLSLKNKTAIVCGSTQGIGKAAAIELAKLGASITLIARNEDMLKQAVQKLTDNGSQTHSYITADFSKPDELRSKLTAFMQGKTVHILVNNTGGPKAGETVSADTSEYLSAFSQHLICNQILVQAVAEGMKKEKWGRIVNVISTSVKQPIKGLGVSNTIRGAVGNWAKTLSFELGKYGITVNNILPGATSTERLKGIINNKAKNTGKDEDSVSEEMLHEIPAGRFAKPEEIAYAIAFLCSPAAGYINGVNLAVDGGRTMCG